MSKAFTKPEDFIFDESFQNYVFKKDEEDARYWQNWIENNPSSKEAFLLAEEVLSSVQFKGYELSKDKYDEDLERLIHAISIKERDRGDQQIYRSGAIRNFYIKIAATILLLLTFGGALYLEWKDNLDQSNNDIAYIEKSTPKGVKKLFMLEDGTKVKLNAQSSLKFPERFGDQRIVEFQGEAFFEVAKDSLHPFIIHSNDLEVKVMGTSFNVRSYEGDNEIEVTVASGLVMVQPTTDKTKKAVMLKPKEKAIYSKSTNYISKTTINSLDVFAWKDGILMFNNLAFDEIVKKLEMWYGVEIKVNEDLHIKKKGYTGKFQNETLNNVLEGISFSLDFKYTIEDDSVTIY